MKIDKICDVMWWTSANTCQNQVKLCTFKVQDDVQLAMTKICLSVQDCRSQASFNDSIINGLDRKCQPMDQNFWSAMRKSLLPFGSKIPIDSNE